MTEYYVTNTSDATKSYVGGNGKRINFERGEKKKLRRLPPEAEDAESLEDIPGWRIEEIEKSDETQDNDGGDN